MGESARRRLERDRDGHRRRRKSRREAERAVRELFALGRACAPALLFLDELEAIVGSRSAVASSATGATGGEGVQLRVLSTLLNEMDGIAPLAQVLMMLHFLSFFITIRGQRIY